METFSTTGLPSCPEVSFWNERVAGHLADAFKAHFGRTPREYHRESDPGQFETLALATG